MIGSIGHGDLNGLLVGLFTLRRVLVTFAVSTLPQFSIDLPQAPIVGRNCGQNFSLDRPQGKEPGVKSRSHGVQRVLQQDHFPLLLHDVQLHLFRHLIVVEDRK